MTKKKEKKQPFIARKTRLSGNAYVIDDPKTDKITTVAVFRGKVRGESVESALASQHDATKKGPGTLKIYPSVAAVKKRYPRITPLVPKLR